MPEMLQHWHLDKKVPIALIFAIFLQAVAVVWWGSGLSSRVETNTTNISTLQTAEQVRIRDERVLEGRLSRIEAQLGSINSSLARIESKLTNDNR